MPRAGWMPSGLDLARIRAEIDKLVLYAAGESTITAAHVRDLVMPDRRAVRGPSRSSTILKRGNAAAAVREVQTLLESGSAAADGRSGRSARRPGSCGPTRGPAGRCRRCWRPTWRSSRRAASRATCSNAWSWSCAARCWDGRRRPLAGPLGGAIGGGGLDAGGQPRLVAPGGVAVDDALAGHLVDQRLVAAEQRLGVVDLAASSAARMAFRPVRSFERSSRLCSRRLTF